METNTNTSTSTTPTPAPGAVTDTRPVLERVLAVAREKAEPMVPEEKPATPPPEKKPEQAAAPETPVAKAPETNAELDAARARVKELEAKIAEGEATAKDLAPTAEAKKLWAEGKKIDAIAKMAGVKVDDLDLEDVVKAFISVPDEEKSPEAKRLDAIEKERAEEKKAAAEKEAKATEQRLADEKKRTGEWVTSIVDANAEQFELCARPKNREEVAEHASDLALEVLKRDAKKAGKELDFSKVTKEQADAALIEVLGRLEAAYEEEGKARYIKKAKESTENVVTPEPKTPEKKGEKVPTIAKGKDNGVAKPGIKIASGTKPATIGDVLEKYRSQARYE